MSQNVYFLSYCCFSVNSPLLCWSFPTSSRTAKMGPIMFPSFQLPPLCIYPLNYWAKEMGPVMAAWPECCQAAVPSQPFPELLVISHAQSDSQRQMVFKLNGCGRNLGAGLISHAHTRGLPRLGRSFRDIPIGWWLVGTAQSRPVIPCVSVIFTLLHHSHPQKSGMWLCFFFFLLEICVTTPEWCLQEVL